MDSFVEIQLREWGFESYIPLFAEEEINEVSFDLLDTDTINKIFVKSGPRLIFHEKYKNYLAEKIQTNELNNLQTPQASTETLPSVSSYDSTTFISDDINLDIRDLPISIIPTYDVSFHPETVASTDVTHNDGINENNSKKRKLNTEAESIFPGGLENLLKKTIAGETVLRNRRQLTNDNRQKICNIIVNELLSYTTNGRIPTEHFEKAALEIEKIFCNEKKEAYFLPYTPKSNTSPRLLAKGKLWSRYINAKRCFHSAKKKSGNEEHQNRLSSEIEKENNESITKFINFLQVCTEPEQQVVEYWTLTNEFRLKSLKNLSTADYFNLYPSLNTTKGYRLILQDFDIIYPNKANIFYEKWPELSQKILKVAEKKSCPIKIVEGEDEEIYALKVLPYLFSPTTIHGKKSAKEKPDGNKKLIYRPSKVEMQESFILHLQNFSDLEKKLTERRAKLQKYQLSLQPFVVINGPLNKTTRSFVYIDVVKFEVESPVKAIDLCFKSIHCLNLQYPEEAKSTWMFIQKEIYGIDTKWDSSIPAISTLIADLQSV